MIRHKQSRLVCRDIEMIFSDLRHCNNIKAGVYVATALSGALRNLFPLSLSLACSISAQFENTNFWPAVVTLGARCASFKVCAGVDNKPFELMRLLGHCAAFFLFAPGRWILPTFKEILGAQKHIYFISTDSVFTTSIHIFRGNCCPQVPNYINALNKCWCSSKWDKYQGKYIFWITSDFSSFYIITVLKSAV